MLKENVVICILLTVSSLTLGSATDGDHVFFYNEFGSPAWETVNDWVKVGSSGYQSYFRLTSDVNCAEDSLYNEDPNKCNLRWYVPATVTVPAGTWCGYQFTVNNDIKEDIIRWYTKGFFQLPGSNTELRITDTQGNVLWSYGTSGWIDTYSGYFEPKTTIRVIVYQKNTATIWADNKAYCRLMRLYTKDIPKYFGYFMTVDDQMNNYYGSFENFTNLNHVFIKSSMTKAQVESVRDQFAVNNCKMLVECFWQFSPDKWDGNNLNISAWNALATKVEDSLDQIAAFYFDEPLWRGLSTEQLQIALDTIHDRFPNSRNMVNLAYTTVETMTWGTVPTVHCEWLAFDDYYDGISYVEDLLEIVKYYKASWQKIFLYVPSSTCCNIPASDSTLASWSNQYYDMANNDPEVIGLIGFLAEGVVNLPLTFDAQEEIGTRIK